MSAVRSDIPAPVPEQKAPAVEEPIFFTHGQCRYYPCHKADFALNCLFCFCPLYARDDCPGSPRYLPSGLKDCSACLFPHKAENHGLLMARLRLGK
jgi:Zn-finger protein